MAAKATLPFSEFMGYIKGKLHAEEWPGTNPGSLNMIWNTTESDVDAAYKAKKAGSLTDDQASLLCTARLAMEALTVGSNRPVSKEIFDWFMEDAPESWIIQFYEEQKKSRRAKGWSVEERKAYGHKISRLEYWSILWTPQDGSRGYKSTAMGTFMHKDHATTEWSSYTRKWNVQEVEAAWDIIATLWGGYYTPDGTWTWGTGWKAECRYLHPKGLQAKDGRSDGEYGKDFTDAERRFAQMISQNQGKGPGYRDAPWWPDEDDCYWNPWRTDGNGWAKFQWVYTGTTTAGGQLVDDPDTFDVFHRLLFSSEGYNAPFNVENMGYFEKKAFVEKVSPDDDWSSVGETLTKMKSWMANYNNYTFLELVLEFLKKDEKLKIPVWDGSVKINDADNTKINTSIRQHDNFFNETGLGPGGDTGKPWSWWSRNTVNDWNPNYEKNTDWDTGLFGWWASDTQQGDAMAEGYSNDYRHITGMGARRFVYWLMPKPYLGRDDNWLGKENYHIFEDYERFILSLVSGEYAGIHKEMKDDDGTRKKWRDLTNPRYSQRLYSFKDSGFIDWEGLWTTGKQYAERDLGNDSLGPYKKQSAGFNEEAMNYIPDTTSFDGKRYDTSELTGNLVEDVNALAGKEVLAGDFLEATTVVENEKATEMIKTIKEALLDFAGSSTHGRGPKELQATSKWFEDNFKSVQVVPNSTMNDEDNKGFGNTININSIENADKKAAMKKLLGFGWGAGEAPSKINFHKNNDPWQVVKWSKVVPIDFERIVRTYQGAAYATAMYYRITAKGHTKIKLLVDDVWEHYAYKCAHHLWRIWEKVLHDNQVGNFYALICIVLANTNFKSDDAQAAMDALGALLRGADDELVKDIGTKPPPEDIEDPRADLSKEQRERFYKQCALLLNMHNLEGAFDWTGEMHKKTNDLGWGAYNGRIHLVTNNGPDDGQKNTILNKMITPTPKAMAKFINIDPAKASTLLPYVRFFSVWNDKDGRLTEKEFDFPKYPTRDISSGNEFDRGDGVGLEEFTWECDGETPATASKYINATLVLNFQTFDDFIALRKNKANVPFRWVDMFVSPYNMKKRNVGWVGAPHTLRYDPEYYRIRVDVGYHTNSDDETMNEALATQNRSFFLVLKDNEININEDMSVTVKAEYGAYIEEAMDSNKFNALSTPSLKKDQEEWKMKWEEATADWKKGNCSDKKLRSIRNLINSELEHVIKKQHKSIMKNLLDLGKIRYVDFKDSAIYAFRQNGVFDQIPYYRNSESHAVKPSSDAAERLKQLMKAKDDPDRDPWMEADLPHKDHRVYYFYFGDLIYLINSSMYQGETPWNSRGPFKDKWVSGAENSRMLLFDFDYHNPLTEQSQSRHTINIASIPISVDYFFQWYVNNIIKQEVFHMGVGNFIKRMLTELITEAMAEVCMSSEEGHYVKFQHGSISVAGVDVPNPSPWASMGVAKKNLWVDPICAQLMSKKDDDGYPNKMYYDVASFYNKPGLDKLGLPFKAIPDEEKLRHMQIDAVAGQFQYVYIYGESRDPWHPGLGDEADDANRGTYHLHLGKNSGLVKNITFEKTNIPYLRESRMAQQGQAGLTQLSAVYNCEIEMIGNTLFLPGQELWINPYGFGGPAFGKPQDPPLNWSHDVSDIKWINDEIENAEKGGMTTAEVEDVSGKLDVMDAARGFKQMTRDLEVTSYANIMGIGGYQTILRTKCTIKPGEFSTIISAKHTYSGYPMIKQSLTLAEYRDGKPRALAKQDENPGSNACRAVLIKAEMDAKLGD